MFPQKEIGWTGKRCKKVNHSTTALSFLVPSFLNAAFSEDDAISQISVDDSRHILYTLSEKGTISVFDLGDSGMSTGRLVSLSQSAITQAALSIARYGSCTYMTFNESNESFNESFQ
jgi:nuclear pore complex protein Nup155